MSKRKLYFAGPLFSGAELEFNSKLCSDIELLGFKVFLPQRDGVEAHKPPYNTMSKEERRERLFEMDRDKILESDVFLFVLDGRVPDEGACVELGIAYTDKLLRSKPRLLIGLHTDKRAAFLGGKLNPMVRVPLDEIVEDAEALVTILRAVEIDK